MTDSMKVNRSIYFATLQGDVIFETKLYMLRLVQQNLVTDKPLDTYIVYNASELILFKKYATFECLALLFLIAFIDSS